jgi:segregation and condensation protein A
MEELQAGEGYTVALPEFEGPLDLLLHLVKRHELDILDIPIAFITEKYLEYLGLMQSLNLDVAGEYLLMAATLAHIKSRELLPQPPGAEEDGAEEEGPDPREELIRRLLEYQKYKEAAAELAHLPALGRQVFRRGAPQGAAPEDEPPFAEVGTFALVSALAEVLKRSEIELSHDVVVDRISITDRINDIVDRLAALETLRFIECFALAGVSAAQLRHQAVVTFLAVLEMARLRMIRILQHQPQGEIYITRTAALHSVDPGGDQDSGPRVEDAAAGRPNHS